MCKTRSESASKKAKVTISAGKVLATVVWNSKGVLLVDYFEKGTIINADRYCNVLQDFQAAI